MLTKLQKYLKGSYYVAKKNIILCTWCNAMCLSGLRFKKHIFHIPYIIVVPLCPTFLKHVDFYKAHRSEKRGVLWLASYPVRCDWPNTSSVWRKCYATYHIWKHTASFTTWRRRQQNCSENKSYSFFLLIYIWAVLCKSSNIMWGRVWMRHFRKVWMSLNF